MVHPLVQRTTQFTLWNGGEVGKCPCIEVSAEHCNHVHTQNCCRKDVYSPFEKENFPLPTYSIPFENVH